MDAAQQQLEMTDAKCGQPHMTIDIAKISAANYG
jgi:hypothetical protein